MRVVLLSLAMLVGCVEDQTACPGLAAASVTVYVVDENGRALEPSSLTWSLDGQEKGAADCVSGEVCTQFVAGWEADGEIMVRASLDGPADTGGCWHSTAVQETVRVERGDTGCHVEGKVMTLALDTTAHLCPDDLCG